ncbi:hypothetical protein BHAOGJBA_5127 [Methylobacterium hispanicum]|uniref:Uncharacterized protein n=1 Tax=Methylobacterium hispanicum TaxID=270350 RepID=A0AAV4ZSM8_9HYPH|nr:hypothetical protein [Methylobacterium hispanicum]GJD91579.1 hypothetical protein BHAOGJBA_5127 [Methylobacterium hispanicum]
MTLVRPLVRAVALLLLAASAATAQSITREGPEKPAIKLEYAKRAASDAEYSRFWQDALSQIPAAVLDGAKVPSEIYATSVKFPNGRTLTFTMLAAPAMCGSQDCAERILEDGRLIYAGQVCTNVEGHFVSTDADTFVACGRPYAIPPKR